MRNATFGKGLAVILLATWAADAIAAPIRVAVEDGSINGSGAAIVAQLNDDTFFDFNATLVNAAGIDTAGELSNFDVVILGGSGHNNADWTTPMANAIANFVNGGGGLILTGWGNYDFQSGAADLILDPLIPGQNNASTNHFAPGSAVINFSGLHPVTAGLPNFAPGANYIELNPFAPEPGDVVLATANSTAPGGTATAVAVKENIGSGGRSVYLGPIYMASSGYNTAPLRTGFADQLLEQATCWAGGACAPVTSAPVPGALALFGFGLFGLGVIRRKIF